MVFLASHGYRCIAHDRRGHGRSSQPWHGNDMNTYADDLATLVDAHGLPTTYTRQVNADLLAFLKAYAIRRWEDGTGVLKGAVNTKATRATGAAASGTLS